METKFGNAKIIKNGYYSITSKKEGNRDKLLHRLVWEDWYGKPVPNGCEIHHLNGDKLDNRIQNLQCVTKKNHRKYHRNSYKPNARVVKYGSFKGKKRYAIWYEGKVIKQSIFKDKLEKIVEEINCTGDEENKDRLSFTFNRDK